MSNTNAKEEFLIHAITTGKVVKAVCIEKDNWSITKQDCDGKEKITLKVGYSEEDYTNFLNSLNFMYNSGYGSQCISGTIWYVDGTWSARGEYDGSEWWNYHTCPKIPEDLK